MKDLVLIPVHTKPEDSVKELDEIYDVVEHVIEEWETEVSFIVSVLPQIMFKDYVNSSESSCM